MSGLRIEGQPAPYYIACQLDDTSGRSLTARLGEIALRIIPAAAGCCAVEVRVGNYELRQFAVHQCWRPRRRFRVAAPLDDDYDVLRRQVWLLADAAYKRAVNVFARKKATFQNRKADESIPDFSRATPVERVLAPQLPATAWND